MTMALFPCLPGTTLDAVNTVGAWLAQDDYQDNQPVNLVILAGNAVIPAIDAACKNAAEQGVPLIISGGIGHSTTFLYAAIAKHPRYNRIPTTGRAEAAILADIAREFWNIPAEHLHVEDQSTNCGENARFSRALSDDSVIGHGPNAARHISYAHRFFDSTGFHHAHLNQLTGEIETTAGFSRGDTFSARWRLFGQYRGTHQ